MRVEGLHRPEAGGCDILQLLERNKRLGGVSDAFDEIRNLRLMSFILSPEPHRLDAFPTVAGELSEVVQLKDTALREQLQPFLWIATMPVRKVVYRADRSILKVEVDGRHILPTPAPRFAHRPGGRLYDGLVGQESEQIDEVARFANDTAAADFHILKPVVVRNCACIHGHHHRQRLGAAFQQPAYLLCVRREAAVKSDVKQ